jgi:hypothetical protein
MFASSRLGLILFSCLVVAALGAACGSSSNRSGFTSGADASLGDGSGDDGAGSGGEGGMLFGDGSAPSGSLAITPTNKTITVTYGQQTPTVKYSATIGGQSVPASFSIDLGQIAGVTASTGVLAPTGKLGGVANVTATYQGQKVSTPVTVVVHMVDNGAPAGFDAGTGTGGVGGVGGSGPGAPVTGTIQTVLQGTPVADPSLAWLYPYDKTVWPQGLLAPLLQWSTTQSYDAIYIHLQEKGFDYQGYFSAPATPFVNHPLLQPAWDTLSYSNQGEPITVTLVFEANGMAYGPLTETWTMAQGTLTGTVYYNSYGTSLVSNYCCRVNSNLPFGGATLAIKRGATSPVLIAGTNSTYPDITGCRVCHSVAAQGATLITQHGDNYNASSAYALTSGNTETPMMPADGTFAFPGISPDGTYLMSNAGPLPGFTPAPTSGLFAVPSGTPIASTGLPTGLQAATPTFSPDAKHVAFNDYSLDQVSLASLDFNQATETFSNLQNLNTPAAGTGDLFPAFLPTNDAVVFEHVVNAAGGFGATTGGSQGELWWVDLATHTAAALATLNGVGYLPTGPNNHMDDEVLDYEPTVNPVASGGYAWVVFTSRRMYGNVATIDPYSSDPRGYDGLTLVTPKKLWVAAIDLNAKAGTDPSHPAFYLPAQELYACNSRGYWVVDPCEANGASCLTGDQCCSGFCEDVDGGFVCGTQPPGCSAVGNKCKTATDCCGSTAGIQCIDGFCSQPTPQ